MKSKFQEAFDSFSAPLSDEAMRLEIERIIDKHYDSLNNQEHISLIHSCVDLTSLSPTDHEDSIYNFVKQVNDTDNTHPELPPVAAICVYPNFISTVKEALLTEGVNIACVSGSFPSSQAHFEVKMYEATLAIQEGANELDIVLHLGNFLAGNYQEVSDEITETKALCKDNVTLKVIIESGALKSSENIRRASILSLYSDADFIKTSTGKEYPGASLEAAYVMCTVLKEYYEKHGKRRGLKVSGGIRTTEEALKYLCIVKEILGEEWMNNTLFRVGASSLVADLHKHLF